MLRALREFLSRATSVLPALGFGRPAEPPTEPIPPPDTTVTDLRERPALHEQHHTPPTEFQDPRGSRPR